jgi:hypothetical protein
MTKITVYRTATGKLSLNEGPYRTAIEAELADGYHVRKGKSGVLHIVGASSSKGMNVERAIAAGVLKIVDRV